MATNIGTSLCILRTVIPTGRSLTLWMAPIRVTRYLAARTIFGDQLVDHSSPDKDIRVEVPYLDAQAELLLIAGTLGKIEKSPLFLIDSGINGSAPKIVRAIDLDHLVAGSMGLVVPVPIEPQARSYLQKFIITDYDIVSSFSDLAVAIFESWPSHVKHLLPRANLHGFASNEWEATIVSMTIDLIRISPIVNGSFPVSLGHSERADLQALANLGSFHDRDHT